MNTLWLGTVASHPVQYQVPLPPQLTDRRVVESVAVFLTDHGVSEAFYPGSGRNIPTNAGLLVGCQCRLVHNLGPSTTCVTPRVLKPDLEALLRHDRYPLGGASSPARETGNIADLSDALAQRFLPDELPKLRPAAQDRSAEHGLEATAKEPEAAGTGVATR